MRFLVLSIFISFFATQVYSACDDQPSNEVDWTNCNFVENLDLSGVGLANVRNVRSKFITSQYRKIAVK